MDWAASPQTALSIMLSSGVGKPDDILARCALFVRAVCKSAGRVDRQSQSLLFCFPDSAPWAPVVAAGLAGLAETVRLERPSLFVKAFVATESDLQNKQSELHDLSNEGIFRFNNGYFETLSLHEINITPRGEGVDLIDGGASVGTGFVLITGGAGAIGGQLARALAEQGSSVLAIGRREFGEVVLPPEVHYQQVDVTDRLAMQEVLDKWRAQLGPVRAVYHCAGLTPGGLFSRRNESAIEEQISIKLRAIDILDDVTATDMPRLFTAYSSLISHSGVIGCADYAMANRAMEAYISNRATRRPGRSISFAWSAWPDGMMFAEAQAKKMAAEGIEPIPIAAAIRWIANVIEVADVSVVVSPYGDSAKILKQFGGTRSETVIN